MTLSDAECQLTGSTRAERIRSHPADLDVDRLARTQRGRQRRRAFRFDADDARPPGVPAGYAADQPTPTDRDQHGVQLRRLCLQLLAERTLPGQDLLLIVGMDRQRTSLPRPLLAGCQ